MPAVAEFGTVVVRRGGNSLYVELGDNRAPNTEHPTQPA